MTAATLHQVCGGRYVLGLGASTKALVEGFHDTAFEHPAAKLRDVVTKVHALLAGQPAQLGHAPAARPLRLGQPPAPEVPIWVAALGHHTIRVAAELGDGWIPALVARDRLPGWAAQLRQAREAAAPHARPLTIAAGPLTAVDENADTARGIAAGCTAWYLSAMGEAYARSVPGQGYAAQVQAIIAANPGPSPRRGTVPPGAQVVLDQLAACGTCGQVRKQLQPWDRAAEHRHNPAATGHALAQHRSDPPGRSAKRPARGRPRGLAAAAGQATPTADGRKKRHRRWQAGPPAESTPKAAPTRRWQRLTLTWCEPTTGRCPWPSFTGKRLPPPVGHECIECPRRGELQELVLQRLPACSGAPGPLQYLAAVPRNEAQDPAS